MSEPMSALQVLSAGAYASIQDIGRRGLRRIGVPWSGVLDPARMQLANALVGNAPGTPVIEHFDGGLALKVAQGFVRLAVAGEAEVDICQGERTTRVACWRSVCVHAGDTLRIRSLRAGRLVVVQILDMRAHVRRVADDVVGERYGNVDQLAGHRVSSSKNFRRFRLWTQSRQWHGAFQWFRSEV